jgi:hypothetical protein
MYVGNHSYHQPELNSGINAYNGGGATGFPELSTTSAPNPNFGDVIEVSSSSVGNFNGVVFGVQHRSRSLSLAVNYQWSHALDEISNGGFEGFSANSVYPDDPFNLRKNYGNADYDTRHYVSGSYVYTMPHYRGPKLLVDNWEASGTFFHSTGLPFSVVDTATAGEIGNYSVNGTSNPLYAKQTAGFLTSTHCGGTAAANGFQCPFVNEFTTATDFGQSNRNVLVGPAYTDSDFAISKGFLVPRWETGKLRIGAQFFNVFNHPNFGQPLNNVAGGIGTIDTTVNPPTSILGSFLGGDASPRLIQLEAKFDF